MGGYMCGMTVAFGVAAALLRRARTGSGGEVDVSLMMAALVLQNNALVRVESAAGPTHATARARLAEARAKGRPFEEQAALAPQVRTPGLANVYFRTYATRDGVIGVACASPGLQRTFMKALGLADEAHAKPITDREGLSRHYVPLPPPPEPALPARTTQEWQKIFHAPGLPAAAGKPALHLLDGA